MSKHNLGSGAQIERVLGEIEDERYMRVALFQGVPKGRKKAKMEFAMGNEISTIVDSDPTLIACALSRPRFYLFTKREPEDVDDVAAVCARATSRAAAFGAASCTARQVVDVRDGDCASSEAPQLSQSCFVPH
jgi:hypothetical protein